ncbi:hypothetical protein [Brevundimonas diminuta]|uniref:hypothetical protein n=1 Tax=Brevundimonas diminuta TaxID=293 RepID=UPI00320B1C8C
MRNAAFPVLAVLALAAVAGQAMTRAPQPAEAQAAGWHVLREGPLAKLAYGAPDSDHLALMLTCMPGEGAAVVYGDIQPRSATLQQASLAPDPVDPLSGGEAFEARLSLDDAALTGLARDGRMPVLTEAGERRLTATRDEQRLIQGFLGYCASGRA